MLKINEIKEKLVSNPGFKEKKDPVREAALDALEKEFWSLPTVEQNLALKLKEEEKEKLKREQYNAKKQ